MQGLRRSLRPMREANMRHFFVERRTCLPWLRRPRENIWRNATWYLICVLRPCKWLRLTFSCGGAKLRRWVLLEGDR